MEYVTRGRGHQRAAAIVPAELVAHYEAMVDLEDGRIAQQRLADLNAGLTTAVPAAEVARRIGKAIDALDADPRPSGARTLVGYPDLWRIRVGNHRVIYTIKDVELVVLALRIAHHSGAYRNL